MCSLWVCLSAGHPLFVTGNVLLLAIIALSSVRINGRITVIFVRVMYDFGLNVLILPS